MIFAFNLKFLYFKTTNNTQEDKVLTKDSFFTSNFKKKIDSKDFCPSNKIQTDLTAKQHRQVDFNYNSCLFKIKLVCGGLLSLMKEYGGQFEEKRKLFELEIVNNCVNIKNKTDKTSKERFSIIVACITQYYPDFLNNMRIITYC